eukprot:jgi/Chrzof1/3750/Cz13g07160.t1
MVVYGFHTTTSSQPVASIDTAAPARHINRSVTRCILRCRCSKSHWALGCPLWQLHLSYMQPINQSIDQQPSNGSLNPQLERLCPQP